MTRPRRLRPSRSAGNNVAGTSIAVLDGARITTLCEGTAARGSRWRLIVAPASSPQQNHCRRVHDFLLPQ